MESCALIYETFTALRTSTPNIDPNTAVVLNMCSMKPLQVFQEKIKEQHRANWTCGLRIYLTLQFVPFFKMLPVEKPGCYPSLNLGRYKIGAKKLMLVYEVKTICRDKTCKVEWMITQMCDLESKVGYGSRTR